MNALWSASRVGSSWEGGGAYDGQTEQITTTDVQNLTYYLWKVCREAKGKIRDGYLKAIVHLNYVK